VVIFKTLNKSGTRTGGKKTEVTLITLWQWYSLRTELISCSVTAWFATVSFVETSWSRVHMKIKRLYAGDTTLRRFWFSHRAFPQTSSVILYLCSAKDQDFHPCNTTHSVIVLFVLGYKFLNWDKRTQRSELYSCTHLAMWGQHFGFSLHSRRSLIWCEET
jgi:hypothetical protein